MTRRTRRPPTTSASSTSTSGSTEARLASMSAWIVLMLTSLVNKKAGSSPASPKGLSAAKSCAFRVAMLRRFASPVAVDPVVPALGVHGRREGERLAGLGVPPELHEAAAEAEQRVVVGGRALDHR